jgi:hypothetical protein
MDGLENLEGWDREQIRAALQDAIAAREPNNAGCKDCSPEGMCGDHQGDADKAETYRGLFARTDEPQYDPADLVEQEYHGALDRLTDGYGITDQPERQDQADWAGSGYQGDAPVRTEPVMGYVEWSDGAYHVSVPGEETRTVPDMAGVFKVLGSQEPVPTQYETDREAG